MRMSAGEENPRLAGDLRKHRRADMAFAMRTGDQLAELVDPFALRLGEVVHRFVGIAADPREEIDAKLLEVACEARGQ
jgi:hypothetical protein